MKHVIYHEQLLGDGLIGTSAMQKFQDGLSEGDYITLVVGAAQYYDIYRNAPFAEKIETTASWKATPPPGRITLAEGTITRLDAGAAFDWCIKHPINGKPAHLAHGFAHQLGIRLEELTPHYVVNLDDSEIQEGKKWIEERRKPGKKILLCGAMSSADRSISDPSQTPNKMLNADIWNQVMTHLHEEYYFVFLASDKDKPFEFDPNLSVHVGDQ